jgi:hypothetical protein
MESISPRWCSGILPANSSRTETIAIDGTVRAWPLARLPLGSGEAAFVPDPSFPVNREGVQIRPLQAVTCSSAKSGRADRSPVRSR